MQSREVEIIGDPENHQIDASWNKNEFLDYMRPQLELIIESRVRIINIATTNIVQTNWIFEYLYNQGLRQGDIICIVVDNP